MTKEREIQRSATWEAFTILKERYGSTSEFCRQIGATPDQVRYWRMTGKISAEYVRKISEECGISVHRLRPDVFGPEPDNSFRRSA